MTDVSVEAQHENDSPYAAKVSSLLLLGGLSFVFGMMPLVIKLSARSWFRNHKQGGKITKIKSKAKLIVSCVLCVGAGVLFATVMVHMLPEIREMLENEFSEHLPMAELLVCAGFFLVFLVEQIAQALMVKRQSNRQVGHHSQNDYNKDPVQLRSVAGIDRETSGSGVEAAPTTIEPNKTEPVEQHTLGHSHAADLKNMHVFRAILVVLALSIHSVFEGMAIGFERDSKDVWLLLIGIISHKLIVIFCIGEQLVHTKRSWVFVVVNISIFSLASPLGIAIGLLSTHSSGSSGPLTSGVLQGLAAGTLLYVTFFELLAPEMHTETPGLARVTTVILGFLLMLAIQLTSHEHSHEHGHDDHDHESHDHHDHDHESHLH